MFRRRERRRLSVALVILLLWGIAASRAWSADVDDFEQRVFRIDREMGQIISKDFLLPLPSFQELSAEGERYIDAAIEFLSGDGHTHQERMIAILSMHNLSAEKYVSFLRRLLDLLDRREITIYEEQLAILPSYEFSTTLIVNYQDKSVRALLVDVLARPDTDKDMRVAIDDILSGRALIDMIHFRNECCADHLDH